MKKIISILLFFLIFLFNASFSENPGMDDIPLGEIEFISSVRGEILFRSYSANPSLALFEGDFVYIKSGEGRVDFTVKGISGINIKCLIEKNKISSIVFAKEGMVVYDNASRNSRLKYYDVKIVLKNLINIYEVFIVDIESSEKPSIIAEAVAKFSSSIEVLIPQMALMNKKYPVLKNFDVSPPLELASESLLLRKIEPRLKDVFYKILGYTEDEDVKREMARLQTVLEQMKKLQ